MTERTKKSEAERRQTQFVFCRASQRRGAHLSAFHHGSRPKESFIARDSASGQASWDVAGTRFAYPFERALPAPACPSPARIAHPSRSARGLMPKAARARVASPPAGTALARAIRECLPDRVRTMGENAACN